MKLAIVEDNKILGKQLEFVLTKEGFKVTHFENGESFLSNADNFQIILLDINLPDINGIEIFDMLKKSQIDAKIIFLTSYSDIEHMKKAFNLECEDYITKPFRLEELILRINKVKKLILPTTQFDEYIFDFDILKIYTNNEIIEITKREKDILELFLANLDKVISFDKLNEKIWDNEALNNTIVASITRLKKKVKLNKLENIRNVGYILKK